MPPLFPISYTLAIVRLPCCVTALVSPSMGSRVSQCYSFRHFVQIFSLPSVLTVIEISQLLVHRAKTSINGKTLRNMALTYSDQVLFFLHRPGYGLILLRIMLRPAGFRLHYFTASHQVITVQRPLLCKLHPYKRRHVVFTSCLFFACKPGRHAEGVGFSYFRRGFN